MRKIALIVLAAAGVSLAGAAQAADIAPVYRKAPPPAMTYMWQGSYIGLYVGGAFGADNVSTTIPVNGAGVVAFATAPATYKLGSSFIGGYNGGYNWQFAPNWVLGYESETGYISLRGSATYPGAAGAVQLATIAATSVGGLYNAWTGRIGYAFDRSLIYAKGGVALATFETGVTNATVGAHIDTTQRKLALGFAAGAGWEYALDNKWSVKAEYLYLGFDKNIATTGNFNGPPAQIFNTTSLSGIHTGKVGLNYKWDWFSLLR